jgi:NADPH:quinone reductase-like Zn-dependent oxidoreductase
MNFEHHYKNIKYIYMEENEKMRAVFTTKYGPPEVMIMKEVDKPSPKNNEILIKIRAIAVTSGDARLRAFKVPFWYFIILMRLTLGIIKPRKPIQGLWLSGVIEKKGNDVKKFSVNQQIYARTLNLKFGANAEYICLPEDCIIGLKPKNLTHEEAVSIPFGGLTALYFLKKGDIKKGDKILIYGASGSVGIAAVHLSKYFETEVYGVCSTGNIDLVKNNGADYVIDYTKQNIVDLKTKFDIVFDTVGKINETIGKKLLNEKGKYVSVFTSGHVKGGIKELDYLTELTEKGALKPVVDKIFPFEQIVEAHRYVDLGHKKGNVVLTIN